MAQELKQKQHARHEAEEVTEEFAASIQDGEAKARRDADIDSILEEIDGVLETNAAAFVASYVQEGGE